MQLKHIIKGIGVAGLVLALGACSSLHRHGTSGDGSLNEADANGVGNGEGIQGGTDGGSMAKNTYYFDFDRSDVRPADKPAILAHADNLVAHPSKKIVVEGHTDPRGSREYNVALGERRGDAVLDVMKSRGVNPDQIRVVSYGAERPAVDGRSEEAYQQDRRAVIVSEQG